jgi:hypothetical protein
MSVIEPTPSSSFRACKEAPKEGQDLYVFASKVVSRQREVTNALFAGQNLATYQPICHHLM